MLAICRKPGQEFTIYAGDVPIRVIFRGYSKGRAQFAIEAPREFLILRSELEREEEAEAA